MTKRKFKEIVIAEWKEIAKQKNYLKNYKKAIGYDEPEINLNKDTIMIQEVSTKKSWREGAIVIVSHGSNKSWYAHWMFGNKVIKSWVSFDYDKEEE